MKTFLLCMLICGGCNRGGQNLGYDDAASHAYRAAWIKNRKGDSAGYKAALEQLAITSPDSRAGRRAQERLHELKNAPAAKAP